MKIFGRKNVREKIKENILLYSTKITEYFCYILPKSPSTTNVLHLFIMMRKTDKTECKRHEQYNKLTLS